MEDFINQILIGLANGSLIAIIALGYTLVYGIVELINFAHGDVFMMGSMMALMLTLLAGSKMGLSADSSVASMLGYMLIVTIICMVYCAVLNASIEKLAYNPLRKAPRLVPLISAIGMSFIVMNVGGFWASSLPGPSGSPLGAAGWNPGLSFPEVVPNIDLAQQLAKNMGFTTGISFKLKQLLVILLAIPLMVGLNLFVARTRLGKAMRATAQNSDAAALMGIDVNRTIALAFLIGGALAGAAGFVYGFYQGQVGFQLGFRQGLNAFTAAVLGGIGNMAGAVLGGFIIGIVEALTARYVAADLSLAAVFATLIAIIIFRPSGLLGDNVPEKV